MLPTLRPGDRLLVDRGAYRGRAPARGEIVVLRDPEGSGRLRVKRVAEPPGRTPEGSIWVEGDHGAVSRDSRQFGPVDRSLVVGRVWYRYAPPEREGEIRT